MSVSEPPHAVSQYTDNKTNVSSWNGAALPGPAQLGARCATLAADCAALAADRVPGLFDQQPEQIIAVLADTAALRGAALYWDGHYTFEQSAGLSLPEGGDLCLHTATAAEAVDDLLLAIEHEWLALPDGPAEKLLDDPILQDYRHHLSSARSLSPYTLSDQAEEALAARDQAAGTGWVQLYYQVTTGLRPVVDGVPVSLEQARSELELEDSGRRERSLTAIYDALEPMAPVLAQCLDSLVADQLAVDEIRDLPGPRAGRDLTNELPSAVVDDMLSVVEEHYPLVQQWFARKARLLGLERLGFAHMRAPIGPSPQIPYEDAVNAVAEAFTGFSAEAGAMVRELIAAGRVDSEPREDKQPGAFCRALGPGHPPRILLSYFGTIEDVGYLAHEFGHALQYTQAGLRQGGLTFDAPLSLSEVAPAFTELLVQDWQIDHEPDPAVRRLLAAKRVDTCIDAIFMSTFLTRFETRAHQLRAEGSALTDERIRKLWIDCGRVFYGPPVQLPPNWGLHWALVPHVIHERFYSYSYAFACLVGLRLYAAYLQDRDSFVPRFLTVLGLGSTAGPAEQLALLGIDLADRSTWYTGMDQFAQLLKPLLDSPGGERSGNV